MPDPLVCTTDGCPAKGQSAYVAPEVDTSSVICGGCGTVLVGEVDFDWEAENAEQDRQEQIAKAAAERLQAALDENERVFQEAVARAVAQREN